MNTTAGETGHQYMARVPALAGLVGVARGERQLGVRKERSSNDLTRVRTWRSTEVPVNWLAEDVEAVLAQAGLTELQSLSRQSRGRKTQWFYRASAALYTDFLETDAGKDRTLYAAAEKMRAVTRRNSSRVHCYFWACPQGGGGGGGGKGKLRR